MNGYTFHLIYDFKTGLRDKSLMLMNYLFPLAFLAMTGLFMAQINPFFRELMVPGMVIFAVMTSALLNLSSTMITEREAGIYRSYRVNGVRALSLVTIPAAGHLIHAFLVSVIVTALSIFVFGGTAPVHWGWFFLVFLLVSLSLSTFGQLIGIVSPSQRAGLLFAQGLYIPSVVLSGIMVPQDMIPENLNLFTSLLPAAHGIRGFEAFAMGSSASTYAGGVSLAVLAASILVNLVLCLKLFQWEDKAEVKPRRFLALLAFVPFLISLAV